MNQQQFDADLNGSDPEEFTDFLQNPIRQLFDNPPRGKSETSFLDKDDNMPLPRTIRQNAEKSYQWKRGQ